MKKTKRFIISLLGSVLITQSLVGITASASPINIRSGWHADRPVEYLRDENSIFFNSENDHGGIKHHLRNSYSYKSRRTRVLDYTLLQTQIYAKDESSGVNLAIYNMTDVEHPDGRKGYTEWFDSPYGVYLDWIAHDYNKGVKSASEIVNDTINYNRSVGVTNDNAFLAITDKNGYLGDAKSSSMLKRRGVVDGDVYLSESKTVDPHVIKELNDRGKRNIFIQGGFETFLPTALFTEKFNIIRIGGLDRQKTLEYNTNMPNEMKSPSMKSPNVDNSLIIEGINNPTLYRYTKGKLEQLRDDPDHNMQLMADIFDRLMMSGKIGDINAVRPDSHPVITFGVNYKGWTTYCSIYGSAPTDNGSYVYIFNVVAPGYYENPITSTIDIGVTDYEYKEPDKEVYWVQPKNRFFTYTKGGIERLSSGSYIDPNRTDTYLNDGVVVAQDDGHFYSADGWDNDFWYGKPKFSKQKEHYNGKDYSMMSTKYDVTAQHDNRDYQLRGQTVTTYAGANLYSGKFDKGGIWVKTDGTPPTSDKTPGHQVTSSDTISLRQDGIYDSRSGLKIDSPYAYVFPKGKEDRSTMIPLQRLNEYADYGTDLSFDSIPGMSDYYGEITVEVWAKDNVGNEGPISTSTVVRKKPVVPPVDPPDIPDPPVIDPPDPPEPPKPPVVVPFGKHQIEIEEYEYEDSTTKWVKLADNFKVDNRVQIPSGRSVKEFDVVYTTDFTKPNTTGHFEISVGDGTHSYGTVDKGFSKLPNDGSIMLASSTSANHKSAERDYSGMVQDKSLNGYRFAVWGRYADENGTESQYIREPKLLGIDTEPPLINFTDDSSSATFTIVDKESGYNRTVVTYGDGSSQTFRTPVFDVTTDQSFTVTVYDNVGNSTSKTFEGTKGWSGGYIQTWKTTVNGKIVLKYRTNAEIYDLVYDTVGEPKITNYNLEFGASSTLYQTTPIKETAINRIYYTNLIEDKYNVPYGPNLRYEHNRSTYARIVWPHIEDAIDQVQLNLYKNSQPWDNVAIPFCSEREDYTWTLYQTEDRYGNPVTKTKVAEGKVIEGNIDMSSYKTGGYEIHVTMYDHNDNPSGTSVLKINHVQPEIVTEVSDLFLKVTAVKDLNWESMTYPIKYNSVDFPLGEKKLSNNGEGIKLGYTVNFSIENLVKHQLSKWSAEYTLLGENGEHLTGMSSGKSFSDLDASENTGYLTQDATHIVSANDPNPDPITNGHHARLFFKHFLPANAEFYKIDGQPYRGKVKVRVKIHLEEIGSDNQLGTRDYTLDLYTIDLSGTAYDDLGYDKQR